MSGTERNKEILEETLNLEDNPLFVKTAGVLEDLEIPYWLDQGTLLGLVREGRLLAGDHDIDLGVFFADYRLKRKELAKRLKADGVFVETAKPHQFSVSDLYGRYKMVNVAFYRIENRRAVKKVYHPRGGKLFHALEGLVLVCAHGAAGSLEAKLLRRETLEAKNFRTFFKKSLFFCLKVVPKSLFSLLGRLAGRARYFLRPYKLMGVPKEHFLQLEYVSLGQKKVPVPGEKENYLALKYGDDWRLPKDEWDFFVDDGAITD
ncbi:MAG: LicD family protein [Bacillota bacterium]